MLVIRRRGSDCRGGMERYYHGSGMFGEIGRKLFSSGIGKAINSGTSSAIAHKVADAVVNGASSTSKKVADAIIKEAASAAGKASANAVNTAIDSIVNKVVKKRPHPVQQSHSEAAWDIIAAPSPLKRKKIDIIDSLIDGSGIIYD